MNLLEMRWIPIRRKSGLVERIAPWQITDAFDEDPVVALAAPRPDFKGALMQFLIGLVQTAIPPSDDEEWSERLENPPHPDILRDAFMPYYDCFHLDGDGPRFMQDLELMDGKKTEISGLLIDAPGENTLKENKDLFIKRGGISGLCVSCVATALFALQTNAPSGGAGHRTSLRGGGPLTTLVVLDPRGSGLQHETLWYNMWLNVLTTHAISILSGNEKKNASADIFPWLAPTYTSEPKTGRNIYLYDVHPFQMYWGMPRRIRLDWMSAASGICDICNTQSTYLVTGYITKNYGINYSGAWQHPLTPYFIDQKTGEALPIHPQPGGMTYFHWANFIEGDENVVPARVVTEFKKEEKKQPEEQFRLWVFGYDMDNMKPRCWYETTFPLYLLPETINRNFVIRTQRMIRIADMIAQAVRGCVKEAWFKRPGDAKGDTAFLKESFLSHTERAFFDLIDALATDMRTGGDGLTILSSWYDVLRRAAIDQFDYWATQGDIAANDPRRIAVARRKLLNILHGKELRGMLHMPVDRKEVLV
jgi:CRISPR system Cascade subunit CasA